MAYADAVGFTTTLDRDTTTVGEPVTLSLVFEGAQPTRVFGMPQVPGLALQGQGQTMRSEYINGQASTKFIYQYAVTAQRTGDFIIPAIKAEVGGQTLSSQPLRLKVVGHNQTAGRGIEGNPFAFVKLLTQTNEVYVGQVFPLEIDLYVLNGQGQDLELPQIKGDGFTFGPIPKQPAQTRTQINNNLYSVVIFKLAATAAKTGSLTLGPAECSLNLRVPRANRRRSDPFGFDAFDLFSPPFELRHATLASESEPLHVLPLPAENVPPGFSGAIGDFTVTLHASPTNVAVGDPITVDVRIAGRGNLDGLTLPPQAAWRDFQVYPPTSKTETSDPLGMQGVKTFEQVVIPQHTAIKTLPAFSFSFFDPERRTYRTLAEPATPLVVRPTTVASAPPMLATSGAPQNPTSSAQDIVALKQHFGTVATLGTPWIERPWFLALQGAPLLAWLTGLVWRRQQDRLAHNPRLRRQRQVAQVVREGLGELRQLAAANDAEGFFAATFRLLQEQIGERVNLPASAITEAVLDERLRPAGLEEEALADLRELFQLCNQARYAPQTSTAELASLLARVETALQSVKSLPAR
ncbi:MAG: BatD family protein [Verrucomicrobia bacterium]|nr:BatD family protein [Verrucomicrobiota bacterium]